MIKTIFFDYDGVIVDSFPCVHEVYKIIFPEMGKGKISEDIDEFKEMYGTDHKDFLKRSGFTEEEIRRSEEIFGREIVKQVPALFPEIADTIAKLDEKYDLFLISANYVFEVEDKMKRYGLVDHFVKIIGVTEPWTPISKKAFFLKVLEEYNLSPEEILVIGDREHDYNDAKAAGINNIIIVDYGWGYDPDNIPEEYRTAKTSNDILKAVETLDRG